jgi:hypothetical protein
MENIKLKNELQNDMSWFRLKVCCKPMPSRQSKISSQVQESLLGLIADTTTQIHSYSWKLLQQCYHV